MTELDELWAKAEAALAEACAMPWGPQRIEALKQAGLIRNEAAKKEIALGQFRKSWHHTK
jgi:hypothetical protein